MYKAAGFSEFLEKLRKKERELYRCLVFPAEEPILEFSLRSYLPTEERVGQEMCMREMPQWVDFWKNPPEKQGRPLWHVETRNRKLALWGKQSGIPVRAVVKSAEDAFCLLHLEKEMREFLEIYRETERELPEAAEWLLENYQKLQPKSEYRKFLLMGSYFRQGVEYGKFLREINVRGVDTKFIERHQKLVCTLWTALHPEQPAKNMEELSRAWQMQTQDRANIGLRVLDGSLGWHGVEQFFLSADELAKLRLPLQNVFITENKTNGLRFPRAAGSIVLFGMGYGVLELAEKASWLREVQLIYWGDLDNNGFDILSKLRGKLPQVKSMLMDEPRLLKDLEAGLVEDTGTVPSALPYLTVREKQVWKLLHDQGKRLEQEKFPMEKIESWLRREGFLKQRIPMESSFGHL